MIKIPLCFSCKNYDAGEKKCPGFKEGFPDGFLYNKVDDGKKCVGNFCYERRIKEENK